MSINQYTDFAYHTFMWQQQRQYHMMEQNDTVSEDTNKEPLFEKPLTPSDVGKLNRLVIPKQQAERHFPLSPTANANADAEAHANAEKGLILCFEDEEGTLWRFRYSYWSSSQSYVLTKGWSRYVKEKQLDAGDVVFFHRHRTDLRRLFISWRRRGGGDGGRASSSSSELYRRYHHHQSNGSYSSPRQYYQPEYPLHAGQTMENQSIGPSSSKTLRLFGVDMEIDSDCSEPSTPDGSSHQLHLYPHQQQH